MVYGTQSSPLTPYCKKLLDHLPPGQEKKVLSMQYICTQEYQRLLSALPDDKQREFKALSTQDSNEKLNNTQLNLLREIIELLWEHRERETVSNK